MSDDDTPNFGPCCVCNGRENVRNVIMVDRRAPVPNTGWGCVLCNLPPDGAVAVVCDGCLGKELRFVCNGFASAGERVSIDELPPGRFEHDATVDHR